MITNEVKSALNELITLSVKIGFTKPTKLYIFRNCVATKYIALPIDTGYKSGQELIINEDKLYTKSGVMRKRPVLDIIDIQSTNDNELNYNNLLKNKNAYVNKDGIVVFGTRTFRNGEVEITLNPSISEVDPSFASVLSK